jgi:hypothetical protein
MIAACINGIKGGIWTYTFLLCWAAFSALAEFLTRYQP